MVLIANKIDKEDLRVIDTETGRELAESFSAM